MKIHLTAILKSKPEFLAEVKAFLLDLVNKTKKEKASILYGLHQSIDDENTFFFYEIWENQEGLDNHNQQSYLVELGVLAQTKLKEAPIVVKGELIA